VLFITRHHAQAAAVLDHSRALPQGDGRSGPPFSSALTPAMQAAGGQWAGGGTGPSEKITSVVGDPPKRLGVVVFDNADKAQAWLKSPGREAIAPQRNQAIKIVRQYIVQVE
jgi:uncharacterized protein (DUF1330 family)